MSKPSHVSWEAAAFCKPAEDLTLQWCDTPPDPVSEIINLQVPESKGIEILVRKLAVSETADTGIRVGVTKSHGGEFGGERKEVSRGSAREAGPKKILDARGENTEDRSVRPRGMRKKRRESSGKSSGPEPKIRPKRGRLAVTKGDLGD
jgi:hypothetical protein